MSENIPESIPTSADPRSHRPIKRVRVSANTTSSTQAANEISNLMLDPSRPVTLPPSSSEIKHNLAAPPEIVANVQGSSAGAGSGEFHVYKASRRREYERLRVMDEEAKKEEEDQEWEVKERERKERDEERTRRNREKRMKRKKGGKGGKGETPEVEDGDGKENGVVKKKPNPNVVASRRDGGDEEDGIGVAAVVKEQGITIHDD
jgi:hypothetical protein